MHLPSSPPWIKEHQSTPLIFHTFPLKSGLGAQRQGRAVMEGGQGSREGFSLAGVLPPGCTSMAGTRGQDDGPPHGPPQQTPTLRGKPGPLGSRLPGPRWEPSSGQCKRQNRVGGGPGLLGTSSQGTLGPGATSLDGGGAGAWLPGGGPTLGVWARGVAGSDHWEHHPPTLLGMRPCGTGVLAKRNSGPGQGRCRPGRPRGSTCRCPPTETACPSSLHPPHPEERASRWAVLPGRTDPCRRVSMGFRGSQTCVRLCASLQGPCD